MNPLVSVIIMTYKRPQYLNRAIDSVLGQTYDNIEIIVVDDNNDDEYRVETKKLLEKYMSRIKYIAHPKNLGGQAARNSGIKISSGEYITFLDDDDFFMPKRIETLVNKLSNSKNNFCFSSCLNVVGKRFNYLTKAKKVDYICSLLKSGGFFGTGSNMFFKKEAIKSIGLFDLKYIRHQDVEYMLRYFRQYDDVDFVEDVLVVKTQKDRQNVPNLLKILNMKYLLLDDNLDLLNSFSLEKKEEILTTNFTGIFYASTNLSKEVIASIKQAWIKYGCNIKHLHLKRRLFVFRLKHCPIIYKPYVSLSDKRIRKTLSNKELEYIDSMLTSYGNDV